MLTAWPGDEAGGGDFREGQVGAQLVRRDQLEQRIADLDVVAGGDDLYFDHGIER
jgi:hypothetical protein